jgi:dihydroorotase
MKTLIAKATIVNEGKSFVGYVVVEQDRIVYVGKEPPTETEFDEVVEANRLYLLPGVIDDHVHFREPGLTHKADIHSESIAAAAGGVTSVMDMPNVMPQTTTLEALEERFKLGAEKSVVNYSYFFGATNTNTDLLSKLDTKRVCGVKLFMGSSTGNMLVDREEALYKLFRESPLLIMAHCENTEIINKNMKKAVERYGEDPEVIHHPEIRNWEACYSSTATAISIAQRTGARLHLAHLTTLQEVELLYHGPLYDEQGKLLKRLTGEVCVGHLLFSDKDYATLGTRIKCNPAIKKESDRRSLIWGIHSDRLDVIATDHAPHLLEEKAGGCKKAMSGMPMIQFSLISMLEMPELNIEKVVQLMCHNPARLFEVKDRGFIRPGYKADLVLVQRDATPYTLHKEDVLSKCGWSPLEGHKFHTRVVRTFCNGHTVYKDGWVDTDYRGEALTFNR